MFIRLRDNKIENLFKLSLHYEAYIMSWECLPIELRTNILSIRFDIRNNACKLIQKNWNKYFGRIESAIEIALELEVDQDGTFLVMWPSNATIMEYCAKVVTGKHNRGFWKFIIQEIQVGLYKDEYTGGPGSIYYNRTEIACDILVKKLNKNNKLVH